MTTIPTSSSPIHLPDPLDPNFRDTRLFGLPPETAHFIAKLRAMPREQLTQLFPQLTEQDTV